MVADTVALQAKRPMGNIYVLLKPKGLSKRAGGCCLKQKVGSDFSSTLSRKTKKYDQYKRGNNFF